MYDNKETVLVNAIRELPTYVPPTEVWKQIELVLLENGLQEAITQLPVHEPPNTVWQKIERQLYSLYSIRNIAAIAASILLMVGVLTWYFWKRDKTSIEIAYAVESMEQADFEADWAIDQTAFSAAKQKFAQYTFLENQKEYKVLIEELSELETAKATLEAAFQRYGKQPHLVRQMKDVTIKQSEVLKKMVTFI